MDINNLLINQGSNSNEQNNFKAQSFPPFIVPNHNKEPQQQQQVPQSNFENSSITTQQNGVPSNFSSHIHDDPTMPYNHNKVPNQVDVKYEEPRASFSTPSNTMSKMVSNHEHDGISLPPVASLVPQSSSSSPISSSSSTSTRSPSLSYSHFNSKSSDLTSSNQNQNYTSSSSSGSRSSFHYNYLPSNSSTSYFSPQQQQQQQQQQQKYYSHSYQTYHPYSSYYQQSNDSNYSNQIKQSGNYSIIEQKQKQQQKSPKQHQQRISTNYRDTYSLNNSISTIQVEPQLKNAPENPEFRKLVSKVKMPRKTPNGKKRKQVKKACTNCRRTHMSCDDSRPCKRCVKLGIGDQCKDGESKKRGRPRKKPIESDEPLNKQMKTEHTSSPSSISSSTDSTLNSKSTEEYNINQSSFSGSNSSQCFTSQFKLS